MVRLAVGRRELGGGSLVLVPAGGEGQGCDNTTRVEGLRGGPERVLGVRRIGKGPECVLGGGRGEEPLRSIPTRGGEGVVRNGGSLRLK
jgi:hypothetical protein